MSSLVCWQLSPPTTILKHDGNTPSALLPHLSLIRNLLCPSYSLSPFHLPPSSLCVGGCSPLSFSIHLSSSLFAPAALPCIIKFSVEKHPPSLFLCCLFLHFSKSLCLPFVQGKTGWTLFLSPPSLPYTLLLPGPRWGLVPGLSC